MEKGFVPEVLMNVEASLARLRELALAIPRPGCDWEEQPRFEPPAFLEAIDALERAAGFPLPTDLRIFFAHTDAVIGLSVHNGYWLGGIEQLSRSITRGDLPRSLYGELAVPIATDGGGNAFLLSETGRIWRWDHETTHVSAVAPSFGVFLDLVAADWAAYIAKMPGWRFLVQ
jgi:hypothetical protein